MSWPDRIRIGLLALSATGLISIAGYERYVGTAYDDGVGVQTFGFGSTTHDTGAPVQRGDTTTPERALRLLGSTADKMQRDMRGCLGDVALYQHEWDAYVSFTYNVGPHAFCSSTLAKKLRATPPDYAGACAELLRWTKAGGRELKGLVKRRQGEYKLCIGEQPR